MQSVSVQSHQNWFLFKYSWPIWILLLLPVTVSQASSHFQSRESIRSAAHEFIRNLAHKAYGPNLEVKIGQLDSRLRLVSCEQSLKSFLPPGGKSLGNTTVGVSCSGMKPWTLYVPAQVMVYREILVNTRPLTRGEVVNAKDLRLESRSLTTLTSGYLTDSSRAIGNFVKRSLPLGTAITGSMLAPPRLIKRGEQVTVVMESAGVEVRATAKAMSDGASGEKIRVQNTSSKQVLEGVIVSAGVVRIER